MQSKLNILEFILPFIYFFVFVAIVFKVNFFNSAVLSRQSSAILYTIKVLAGIVFYLAYTYYYNYYTTSDAYKYFQDSTILFNSLKENPLHYIQMLTGINSSDSELVKYYEEMNYWFTGIENNIFNDNRTVIRFNAFVYLFSSGNFYVHILFICFLSFSGLVALLKAFVMMVPNRRNEFIVAVFLIPSVLFWTSGVLKEGLLVFGLGFFVYSFTRILFDYGKKWMNYLGIILFAFAILMSKAYILFVLIPGIFTLLFLRFVPLDSYRGKKQAYVILGTLVLLVTIGAAIISKNETINPLSIIAKKQSDFINLANGGTYFKINNAKCDTIFLKYGDEKQIINTGNSKAYKLKSNTEYYTWYKGRIIDTITITANDTLTCKMLAQFNQTVSKIEIHKLQPTLLSFLKNTPQAIFNGLFRPTFADEDKTFMKLCAIENYFLLFTIFLSIIFFKKPKNGEWSFIILCISFTLLLAVLIGFTTPVLGALVRYKVPLLPFIFGCFFILINPRVTKPLGWIGKLLY